MADKNAGECRASLHAAGFQTRADPTERFATKEDPGRGDVLACRNGRAVYIEIKCGDDGFDLKNWRTNQRQWALEWAIGTGTDYYLWLRIGTAMPHLTKNPMRKRTWLVPYHPFTHVAGLVQTVQDTLPLVLTKHHSLKMREHHYDAVTLLAAYELTWAGNGKWCVPESHVFSRIYLQQPPLGVVTEYVAIERA